MKYFVYQIKIDSIVRYIGITNNVHRRTLEHRRDLKNFKDKGKYLYKMIKESSLGDKLIDLEIIYEYENKGDANRMEAYLILKDYFSYKQLWQSFPISIKYF